MVTVLDYGREIRASKVNVEELDDFKTFGLGSMWAIVGLAITSLTFALGFS